MIEKIYNIEEVTPLLCFSKRHVFHMQVMLRRKDGHSFKSANNRIIADWYPDSIEKYKNYVKYGKILCDKLGARMYINPMRKNKENITYQMLDKISQNVKNKSWLPERILARSVDKLYGDNKIWVIDVDDPKILSHVIGIIEVQMCGYDKAILKTLPTVNGYHILTRPFDRTNLVKKPIRNVTIHTNGLALLYANKTTQ